MVGNRCLGNMSKSKRQIKENLNKKQNDRLTFFAIPQNDCKIFVQLLSCR